eukprot:m.476351 g.476351  ORF g.476351 m.476351 type:complete len:410 (+) comp57152_c0_seq8:48-1277(+)
MRTLQVHAACKGSEFGASLQTAAAGAGLMVARVSVDGVAAEAGLLEGDVITAVNNAPVGAAAELLALLHQPAGALLAVSRHDSSQRSSAAQSAPLFSGFSISLSQLVQMQADRSKGSSQLVSFGGLVGIAQLLRTDLDLGILGSEEDLKARRTYFGANCIPAPRSRTFLQLMWDASQDFTLLVLMIAAIISLVFGLTLAEDKSTEWIEGAAIMVSIAAVILVTAANDYQKEKQFKELKARQDQARTADVVRSGQQRCVPVDDLVVGDVFLFSPGTILPADGIFIRGHDVACDESALTGESVEIKKSADKQPFLLSGTAVMKGTGSMLVTCVGLFSEEGIIQKLITGVGKEEVASKPPPTHTLSLFLCCSADLKNCVLVLDATIRSDRLEYPHCCCQLLSRSSAEHGERE